MKENITISDIITNEDLNRWETGDMVLIDAPTGKGKSYFIMNGLYDYCKKNYKKILFLTNRNLLKDQFITSLRKEHKLDIIDIRNYQSIEKDIIEQGQDKIDIDLSKYDYVIADECHYFFTDALFNDKTDLFIEFLTDYRKSIVILLSAAAFRTGIDVIGFGLGVAIGTVTAPLWAPTAAGFIVGTAISVGVGVLINYGTGKIKDEYFGHPKLYK